MSQLNNGWYLVLIFFIFSLLIHFQSLFQWGDTIEKSECNYYSKQNKMHDTTCYFNVFSQQEFEAKSMWLQKYLTKNNALVAEGHSGQIPSQINLYVKIFEKCNVHRIAEIGFNAGHSMLIMLMSNPHAIIQSFDLGQYETARVAFSLFKTLYPIRDFDVIWGDSRQTVPTFISTYQGPKFDVIIVDGGHSYDVAKADILNMQSLAHKDTVLVIDDTICTAVYCVDAVVNDLEQEGNIRVQQRIPLSFQDRGVTLANYNIKE